MAKRVDWEKAKLDFLKSSPPTIRERRAAYAKKHGFTTTNKVVHTRTKGWTVEKKNLQKLATEQGMQEAAADTIQTIKELYKPSMDELALLHQAVMGLIKYSVNQMSAKATNKEDLSIKDLAKLWEMMKAEKLEPTKVGKLDAEGIQTGPAVIIVSPDVADIIGID